MRLPVALAVLCAICAALNVAGQAPAPATCPNPPPFDVGETSSQLFLDIAGARVPQSLSLSRFYQC